MAGRSGKCVNYASCNLAYRNADIEAGDPFVCPECGKPLREISVGKRQGLPGKPIIWLAGGGVLVVGLIAVGIALWLLKQPKKEIVSNPTPTPTPVETTPTPSPSPGESLPTGFILGGSPTPAATVQPTPTPAATASPTPVQVVVATPTPAITPEAEVVAPPVAVAKLDEDPESAENQETRKEVLQRIDKMPNLTDSEKDQLYERVDRARAMMKIITIPFGTGQRQINAESATALCKECQAANVRKLIDDPTVVFVMLGFADKSGNPEANVKLSRERAESVMNSLQTRCGLQNVMHSVGMGGSELLGAASKDKNRAVEVWAVLP